MLTADGFVPKRTPQLKLELEQRMLETFGGINLAPESVFGQLVGLTIDQQNDLWAQLEELYWSQYPDSAVGVNLDRVAAINGVARLPARATSVLAVVSGTAGTAIPVGRIARAVDGQDFALAGAVTINAATSVGVRIAVNTLTANTNYTITLGGVAFTYNSGAAPTAASILTNLLGMLPTWVTSQLTSGAAAASLALTYETPTPIVVSGLMTITEVSNYGTFLAQTPGPTSVPAGTLAEIMTPVSGWVAVTNRAPGTAGQFVETDDELRLRRAVSLRLGGSNTLDAIVSHLQQTPGVLTQRVVANTGNTTNAEGIPGHSIRAVVDGGLDADIARTLFTYVAAGIGFHGAVTVNVLSAVTGQTYPVKFDRPGNLPFYVTVTVQASPATPLDAIGLVRAELMALAEELAIAEPLLYSRLFGPLIAVLGKGTDITSITTGLAPSPTAKVNLIPSAVQRLVLAPERIQVFVLPSP